jgi:hypothetical protein
LTICQPPNKPIDKGKGRFITHWDPKDKKFILKLYFMDPEDEKAKLKPK